MLARQSAPLPRQFSKVSACFIFNSQCGHALTVLRSLKVILNFRTHPARPVRSRSQASSTSTISPIFQSRDVTPAAIVTEAGPGLQCEQAQGRHYQGRQAECGQGDDGHRDTATDDDAAHRRRWSNHSRNSCTFRRFARHSTSKASPTSGTAPNTPSSATLPSMRAMTWGGAPS